MKIQQLPRNETKEIIKRHKKESNTGYFWLLLTIILFTIGWIVLMKAIDFSNKHEIVKNPIVQATFKWPLEIRVKEEPKVVEKIIEPATPESIDTPIKKYICDKFGQFECLTAVAVANHEGLNRAPDDQNTNENGSIDTGIFRINSVHQKRPGCSLAELIDAYKNVDCAKILFDEQGWGIWVAYSTGRYLADLDK